MSSFHLASALALAAMVCLPQTTSAAGLTDYDATSPRPRKAMQVPVGASTMAPFSYIRFCVDNPRDCQAAGRHAVVDWQESRSLVTAVNRRVNSQISPVNDAIESWNADVDSGDCEDFALTKRRELLRAGVPAGALRMAVGTTRRGEWHAVLVVSSTAGDMVLDNRSNTLKRWDQTDLRWSKIASAEDPQIWRVAR